MTWWWFGLGWPGRKWEVAGLEMCFVDLLMVCMWDVQERGELRMIAQGE